MSGPLPPRSFPAAARRAGQAARFSLPAFAAAATLALAAPPAGAFSVLFDEPGPVRQVMESAARWSAGPDPLGRGTGLHDGIQVAVEASFAENLDVDAIAGLFGIDGAEARALVERAVRDAFAQWESPALRFAVTFGGGAEKGTGAGAEIDLFAEPSDERFFGYTHTDAPWTDERLLTNGMRLPGRVITGADIVLNTARVREGAAFLAAVHLPPELVANALEILVAHEAGHALGLHHPNEHTFYDTNTDPYDRMRIDPRRPFDELLVSAIPLDTPAIDMPTMWGGLSRAEPEFLLGLLERLEDPGLRPDDIGGRDVLYPVACPGDCDGDGQVHVAELIVAVRRALAETPADACPLADPGADGRVEVADLVAAVRAALEGCRAFVVKGGPG